MSRFRKSGTDGTSALLNKVNSQLRGEKQEEEDDEGLGAYLSSLGKTSSVKYKSKQASIDWDKFEELSEKSASDDDLVKQKASNESAGSKFLKKKPQANTDTTFLKKNNTQQKSDALSKASKFSVSKYEAKPRPELVRMLSDSDMDISISTNTNHFQLGDAASLIPATKPRSRSRTPDKSASDKSSSIGKGGNRFLKKPTASAAKEAKEPTKPTPEVSPAARPTTSDPKPQPAAAQKSHFHVPPVHKKTTPTYGVDDSDSSSMSIGKGGSRFLKKKAKDIPEKIDSPKSPRTKKPKVNKKATNEKRDQFTLKSSLKYSTEPQLDTSEESLADFMQNIDGDTGKLAAGRAGKSKSRTPRTPSRSGTLLDEIKEEEEQRLDATLSDDDSFKTTDPYSYDSLAPTVLHVDPEDTSYCEDEVNVFDVDALDPLNIVSSFDADETSQPKYGHKSPRMSSPKASPKSKSSTSSRSREKVKKQKAVRDTKEDDFFANFGLQTVEDLLGGNKGGESEVATDIEEESRDDRSPSPLRSILSPSPKPDKTPRTSRSRVHYSLEEITEIRSRSPSPEEISTRQSKSETAIYTEDFDDASIKSESTIRTENTEQPASAMESITEHIGSSYRPSARSRKYSDDFMSVTESKWSSTRRDLKRAESAESTAYEYSDTFSDISDSQATENTVRKGRGKKSVEVQTGLEPGDLVYQWDSKFVGQPIVPPGLGLASVDPSPIATHVVSADALETLTAYSPSVIALNEMLKQQLQLTENFMAIQKHLHQNLIQCSQPDFSYTTLQDTKEYIKKHKKPRLTFKEALRQVKAEMGIK